MVYYEATPLNMPPPNARFARRLRIYLKDAYIASLYRMRMMIQGYQRYFRALGARGYKPRVVLCYPEKPTPMHSLYMILSELGCSITRDPHKKVEASIYFEDATVGHADAVLEKLTRE